MKSFAELGLIAGFSVVAGLGNWLVSGRPSGDPIVELKKVELKKGEILLSEALKDGGENVVWIDARSAESWRKERMKGSINITMQSDENLGDQLARHTDALFSAKRVIVYCDDVHCTVSHDMSKKLKGEDYRDFIAGEILVLQGGMVVLRDAGLVTSSNPGP